MSHVLRLFMVLLVLNVHIVRAGTGEPLYPVSNGLEKSYEAGCETSPEFAIVTQVQKEAYEVLFEAPYEDCNDLFLILNEEVTEVSPTYHVAGTRGNESFSFVVSGMTRINDWQNYGLSAEVVDQLTGTNAMSSIVRGKINGFMDFMGLTVSFDDPNGTLPRTHALMLMAYDIPPQPVILIDCGENQAAFDRCHAEAEIDYHSCLQLADDDFDTCAVNDGLIVGGIGGFLACVINEVRTRGPASIPAIKGILVGCAIFGLVVAAVAIYACYNQWKNDTHDCALALDKAMDKCTLICLDL